MSQINQNLYCNIQRRNLSFKAEQMPAPMQMGLPEADLSNVQLPEIYQIPEGQYEEKSFKDTVKKIDIFDAVSPWLEYPLLTAGTAAATLWGIDQFTRAWSGEYESSLLGKANKLGDNITNAKIFKKKPVKKALDGISKVWSKITGRVGENSMVKAMRETPCIPEWNFGKIETISQNRRIIQDDFLKIVDHLALDSDGAIALKKVGLNKTEREYLLKRFKVDKLSKLPEDQAVNAILMKRLGKSEAEISRFAAMGKGGLNNVKEELRKAIGLTKDDIGKIRTDEADKLVSKVFEAAKKGKGKIWVGDGEIPLLGKFQPLKRKIGFDSVFNRMHSITGNDKSTLGKSFSKAIQKVYRGFTFGGGKGGMLIFIVPNLVRAAVNTAKAEPEEKVSTAIQGGIGAISWVFTMPIATKALYSLGGIKYAGMGKDKVEKYRGLIDKFNKDALNMSKATYKSKKKALVKELGALKKVEGQNLLTKMCRKIASVFTSDLGMIQPHKDSLFGKIGKFFKNAGNVPVRFISFMVISGILDTIIHKTLSGIFGRAHDEANVKAHQEEKARQKKFTREDLENRCLQLQQKKVLGIDQPKEEEFKVPTYAQVSQVDESQENLEEQAQPQMLPQQENKFRLPQETQVGNAVESKTSEVTPDVSAQNIPQQNIEMNTEQSVAPAQAVPVQEVPAQPVVLDQPQISNIQLEQPVQEVMPRDDYTYIPSSAPAVDLLAQRGSRLDTYTYIPSQENVLKKQEEPAINKYIPSQEGAKINKTYDNSGLASALQRADRAEQQAIEILNGKFRHM